MPTPPEALAKNLDFILNPFYRRGPGDLGLGWLLLASLRRVCIGFLLGALVAIPVGVWIGLSYGAWLALNPIIQVFKPVSPLVWLPIALAIFNAAEPSAIFVIFITSLWSTIDQYGGGGEQRPQGLSRGGPGSRNASLEAVNQGGFARQLTLYFYRSAD